MSGDAWPTELRFQKGAGRLVVAFDDGSELAVPYKTLREESPSAENKGHGNRPPPPRGLIPDDISVERAEPVGRYAVRIVFSDGHATGLYTWRLLRKLGEPA